MEPDYQALVTRLLHAQSRGDWDAMFEVMHDDGVFELPFQQARFEGRDAIVTRMAPAVATMEGLIFSDIAVHAMAAPGWVTATYRSSATIQPGARPYRQTYIAVLRFVGERAVLFREYMDTLHLAIARGKAETVA